MNDRVKKLIYQSHYRSMKEADLLLSEFAKSQLSLLSDEQINLYENLLSYPDSVIQSFVIGSKKTPEELKIIVAMIANFIAQKIVLKNSHTKVVYQNTDLNKLYGVI
jgi:succinate dehydrogenase flavin-adding protein (antitoxin of CptAB toxin-antitoxin module)